MINMKFINLLFLYLAIPIINAHDQPDLPKFGAFFCFGDSFLDTGNNNYIKTFLKSNYPPYGKDFPGQMPTGRFSNGKLISDMLASVLGIKETVPPFLDPNLSDNDIVTGVNFASSGAGFDDKTSLLTNVIPISKQLDLFKEYLARLKSVVGEEKARHIVSTSLVAITGGTNDYFFSFYDIPTRRLEFNATQYRDFLHARLQNFIKELYKFGFRSMLVGGVPPIGSLPVESSIKIVDPFAKKYSVEEQNKNSADYNEKLIPILRQLERDLPGTKIVYNDFYGTIMDFVTHPQKYGFFETKNGCCGSGVLEQEFLCDKLSPPCEEPSKFVFWDRIHPTLAAYQFLFKNIRTNILPKFL